jgi:hypothetical protein
MMLDGHLSICKECKRSDSRKHRAENIDKARAYDRERGQLDHRVAARRKYAKTKEGKDARKRASKKWDSLNRHKKRAHLMVRRAIKRGYLKKAPCIVCGSEEVEAHHTNYDKPLDVTWLCSKHHKEEHKRIREKQRGLIAMSTIVIRGG